jgi:hypothetical protein
MAVLSMNPTPVKSRWRMPTAAVPRPPIRGGATATQLRDAALQFAGPATDL